MMSVRRALRPLVTVIGAVVAATMLVAVTPTAASADVIVGATKVTKVKMQPAKRRLKIVYHNNAELPPGARVGVQVYPALSNRGGALATTVLSGSKGKNVTYMSTGSFTQVVRVQMSVQRTSPVRFLRLVAPKKRTVGTVVSAKDALANAVVAYVPGAVLSLVPHTRFVKMAGRTLLGWSIFADVEAALVGSGGGCPTLKAGQFIRTTSKFSRSGTAVKQTIRYQVWRKKKAFKNGKSALCTVKTSHTFS